MFLQKLYRKGDSIVMNIPEELLKTFSLKVGSLVIMRREDDRIIISPKTSRQKEYEKSKQI